MNDNINIVNIITNITNINIVNIITYTNIVNIITNVNIVNIITNIDIINIDIVQIPLNLSKGWKMIKKTNFQRINFRCKTFSS